MSAIVDVIATCDDSFLDARSLPKGSMRVLDSFQFGARDQAVLAARTGQQHATFLEGFAIVSPIHDQEGRVADFRYEHINDAGCRINNHGREAHFNSTLLRLFPHLKPQVAESGL